jgi:hypothetical protein
MDKLRILNQIQSHLDQNKQDLLKKKMLEEKLRAKLLKLKESQSDQTAEQSESKLAKEVPETIGATMKNFDCFFTMTEPRIPFIPTVVNEKVLVCKAV